MDVLVAAGGFPKPDDPMYEYTQGGPKALVDVAGKPMVQWVLDAIGAAKTTEKVVVVGLEADSGVTCSKPLSFVPNQGGLVTNIIAGAERVVELNPEANYVLSISADIPTISGEMIDWVVNTAMETEHDIYLTVVSRETMEKRFPGSARTFTKIKGIELSSGDIGIFATWTAVEKEGIWTRLGEARKNPLKQAAMFGFDTLLMILFRLVDLDGLTRQLSKRLGLNPRALLCPYAEVAMDVDKPHQLEIIRADLAK
ncbi:MAG: NTP transferase domain-containing protein [Chloroflexi bacterium]|nr:NTP transferase domain-containing protein [Chloroflexota bacterium]